MRLCSPIHRAHNIFILCAFVRFVRRRFRLSANPDKIPVKLDIFFSTQPLDRAHNRRPLRLCACPFRGQSGGLQTGLQSVQAHDIGASD